ncbi:MAG: F-type H+-transporting ATPase subunit epsilon [Alphaproteobacteria bacterium]|nr:F-type H+-transporting ATPase subunit epsilon [Alphaproteobacteria bacterium]
MADRLTFELVSPERLLLSAQVDMVVVPGTEGEFGVLAGHAPLVSTLRPGVISVHDEKTIQRIFVRGGFAEVTPAGLTVLAEEAIDLASIDQAGLEARIKNAEEDVADAASEPVRAAAQAQLDGLRALQGSL